MGIREDLSSLRNLFGDVKSWLGWFSSHPIFRWATGGVSGIVTYFGLYWIVNKVLFFLGQLQLPVQTLQTGIESTNASLLSRANYFFPLDTCATAVLLYSSIWTTCLVVKFWLKAFKIASHVVEKVPFLQ